MILSFYATLLLTIVAASLWWLSTSYRVRVLIMSLTSLLVIFVASPLILLNLALFLLIYIALEYVARKNVSEAALKLMSWMLFVPLIVPVIVSRGTYAIAVFGPAYTIDPTVIQLAYLGFSYTSIRLFIAFRQRIADGNARPLAVVGTLLFYGSFAAGPIAGMRPFYAENIAENFRGEDLAIAVARIGWGAAKLFVMSRILKDFSFAEYVSTSPTGEVASAWLSMYKDWLTLYLDFSGYTDIAIGTARLYGVTLPENFRAPFLATSIQNYWQRWHQSLGAFIGNYLYKPLVRQTGRPTIAIFVAFLFVGLWHQVNWTYLFWGMGHGAALALNMAFARQFARAEFRNGRAWLAFSWAATMTLVSFLSMVANSGSLSEAYGKTAALLALSS